MLLGLGFLNVGHWEVCGLAVAISYRLPTPTSPPPHTRGHFPSISSVYVFICFVYWLSVCLSHCLVLCSSKALKPPSSYTKEFNHLQVSQDFSLFASSSISPVFIPFRGKVNATSFEPFLSYLRSLEVWLELSCFSALYEPHITLCWSIFWDKDLKKWLPLHSFRTLWQPAFFPFSCPHSTSPTCTYTPNLSDCFLPCLHSNFPILPLLSSL